MIRRTLILVLFSLLFPAKVVFAAATRVHIYLTDSAGQPLADVPVALDLRFYESASAEPSGAFSDECTTDAQGECTILIGETRDLRLRGRLDLGGHGSREVEWRGGVLEVSIRAAQPRAPRLPNCGMLPFLCMALLPRKRVRV